MDSDSQPTNAKRRAGPLRWLWRLVLTFLALGAIAAIALAAWLVPIWWDLPDTEEVLSSSDTILILQDINGDPLLTRNAVPSRYVPIEDIPDIVKDAVIAIEDRRFYDHFGVDLKAVSRAAVENVTAGGIRQGGSTITQQLAKLAYLEPDRTMTRKVQEALLALRLESDLGKDGVLERYLNLVYLGSGARGVGAASVVYFGRPLEKITVAQAAVLAATIQTPSATNLNSAPEETRQRAGLVIDLMEAQGRIQRATAEAARVDLVTLRARRSAPRASYGGWFADWVTPQARAVASDLGDVVTLRTTLDPRLQRIAETAIARHLPGPDHEAALIALRPDGSVAAMVGGRDYSQSEFNRATDALRSPGSTFKTFVLMTALQRGWKRGDRVFDRRMDIDGYTPENFDGRYTNRSNLNRVFQDSRNAAFVWLGQQVGVDEVIKTARTLGIQADLSPTPAIALGSDGIPLLDLAEAYAAIATGRTPIRARGLEGYVSPGSDDLIAFEWRDPPLTKAAERLMDARRDTVFMLERAVLKGTGHRADPGWAVAGKTGTGQDFRDALFVGFDTSYVVAVWVGKDDNTPMDEISGGTVPALIFRQFVRQAADGEPARIGENFDFFTRRNRDREEKRLSSTD